MTAKEMAALQVRSEIADREISTLRERFEALHHDFLIQRAKLEANETDHVKIKETAKSPKVDRRHVIFYTSIMSAAIQALREVVGTF